MHPLDTTSPRGRQLLGDFVGGAPAAGKEAVEFLRDFDTAGRHNLVAINPMSGHIEGRTFRPGEWEAISDWIAARNGRANLYFTANEPVPGAPDRKLTKEQIGAIRCVFVDIDPDKREPLENERARLAALVDEIKSSDTPPTWVIDSGGGVQFLWSVAKQPASTAAEQAEAQSRCLRNRLGGDAVQNIDRLLRLPGTINIPDAKKRAAGRVERDATLLLRGGAGYTLDALTTALPTVEPPGLGDRDAQVAAIKAAEDELDMELVEEVLRHGHGIEDLPEELQGRFAEACYSDKRLAALWSGDETALSGKDNSLSGWLANLASGLGRSSETFDVNDFGRLAAAWPRLIGDEKTLAERSLTRAWGNIAAPLVQRKRQDVVSLYFEPIAALENSRADSVGSSGTAKRFTFTSLDEAATGALVSTARPLVKDVLDQGAMSVLYGESNVGKTFVAMDIAYHIARGLAWAGRRTAALPVLYIAAEGGGGARKRAAALVARHGRVPDFQMLLHPINLLRADADLGPLIASIRASGIHFGLIVVDTLSRAMAGGDENASTDMGAMVRHLDAIRAQTSAHLMIVHHSGKDRARGARGHSLLRAATDTEIEVADGFIKVTKQRDLDKSFKQAFDLDVVTLGVDQEGDPVTSCTLRLRNAAAEARNADAKHDPAEADRKRRIAAFVLTASGGAPTVKLSSIVDTVGEMMRRSGLTKAKTTRQLTGEISASLIDAVIVENEGQKSASKRGRSVLGRATHRG